MQKIERHTAKEFERESFMPLISAVLIGLLAGSSFFDAFRFGERTLSFFVAIDIVTVLTLIAAYHFIKRSVTLTLTGVQLSACGLFVVATAIWYQHTPTLDAFFGITDGAHAYLPVALFALTIVFAPFVAFTTKSIYLFLGSLFALPLLILPMVLLEGGTATSAYIGVVTLVVGALALPLYKMTLQKFLIACTVAGVALLHVWLALDLLPQSVLFVLLGGSGVYVVRMLIAMHYARRTNHIATKLTHSPTLRIQGMLALVSISFILFANGALYWRAVSTGEYTLLTQEINTLTALRDSAVVGYQKTAIDKQLTESKTTSIPSGTLTSWVQSMGTFGALAFLALMLTTMYLAFRALREPEYYEKSWYTCIQLSAGIVGIGTLAGFLMPIGSGGMLLLAMGYALLSMSMAKISPAKTWVLATTKRLMVRRVFAFVLACSVVLTWYYSVCYAAATISAAKSAWDEAYQRMESPHYLAEARMAELERFRGEIASVQDATTTLEHVRTVTAHIVEARKWYPDDTEIMQVALLHYELLTQLGVAGAAQESITILEQLYARYPESAALILRYATSLLEASRPSDARAILDKHEALLTERNALQRNHLYAYVLMAQNDYEAAATMFAQAIAEGVSDSATYLAYGISQVHTDVPAARRILAETIIKFPDDASVYVYAALIEQIAGDLNAARAVLEKGTRRATIGDTVLLHTLLDELTTYGSITSIGVANVTVPQPSGLATSTATSITETSATSSLQQ